MSVGIGEELRTERLRQRLSLEDIAQRTRISLRSLESIEADAFERLPGLIFARNFVRLYAIDLKIDPEALLARMPRVDIEAAPLPNPPVTRGRTKWDPRLTAALASVLWIVTASGAGAGAWYYVNRHAHFSVASAPAPKPVAAAVAPATNLIQTADAQNPDSQSFDKNRPVQVVITAREATWVQVSADGQTAFVGTLHPNDTRSVAADALVKILTGNAGGLVISLNGKPLEPIGPNGQVRTVSLTAEGPQFVPQNPPASSPL